jgi:ATP-dependent RNA helicase RhlE
MTQDQPDVNDGARPASAQHSEHSSADGPRPGDGDGAAASAASSSRPAGDGRQERSSERPRRRRSRGGRGKGTTATAVIVDPQTAETGKRVEGAPEATAGSSMQRAHAHHRKRTPADPAEFAPLGLEGNILAAIGAMGFSAPTGIQEQAIPLVLEGRDVVGCSQTGSGKTLAFVAPILQKLGSGGHVHALVITPTRELARQIEEVAHELAQSTGHSVTAVFGGVDYDRQKRKLKDGVDFLVATPGRLLDLKRRGDLDLSHVKYLVVDEADRLLDMGFWPDVRRIVHSLPKERHNLLFSATMSRGVLEVIHDTLHAPVHIEISGSTTVDTVDQVVLPVNADQKTSLLAHYFQTHDPTRTLVFTRTKVRADRVTRTLNHKGVQAAVIHSDLGQGQRMDTLEDFKSGRIQVLVATDIVARGIDVQDISHVVNYDVPERPEDYIHRVGRTARAGATGTAITLLSADEGYDLKDIESLIGQDLPRVDLEGFEYDERNIPPSSQLPRRPAKLVYSGGARRAMKFGLRSVKKGTGRVIR